MNTCNIGPRQLFQNLSFDELQALSCDPAQSDEARLDAVYSLFRNASSDLEKLRQLNHALTNSSTSVRGLAMLVITQCYSFGPGRAFYDEPLTREIIESLRNENSKHLKTQAFHTRAILGDALVMIECERVLTLDPTLVMPAIWLGSCRSAGAEQAMERIFQQSNDTEVRKILGQELARRGNACWERELAELLRSETIDLTDDDESVLTKRMSMLAGLNSLTVTQILGMIVALARLGNPKGTMWLRGLLSTGAQDADLEVQIGATFRDIDTTDASWKNQVLSRLDELEHNHSLR